MTPTELFKYLGAPLENSRWSWGGIRRQDDAVFLRVWQDRKRKHQGSWYMMVTHHEKYLGNEDNLCQQGRLVIIHHLPRPTRLLELRATGPPAAS